MELPIWKLCRYRLLLLTFLGNMVAYMVRFSVNVTVIHMTDSNTSNHVSWNQSQVAQVEASFFYGYCAFAALFGFFSDKLGPRLIIAIAIGGSGALNLLFSLFATMKSVWWSCILRVLQGSFQAGLNAPQKALWGRWAPTNERTTMVALFRVATKLGIIVVNIVGPLICLHLGWEYVYYMCGALSIIWCCGWVAYARDSPAQMKNIDQKEREFIEDDLSQSVRQTVRLSNVPWSKIVTNRTFIGLCVTGFGQSIIDFIILEMLPLYLHRVKKLGLANNGIHSAVPLAINITVSTLTTLLIDLTLRSKYDVDRTTIRKTATTAGLTSAVVLVCVFNYSDFSNECAIILMMAAYGFSGMATVCRDPVLVDLAPLLAGTLHGLIDTVYSLGGVVVPLLCNYMLANDGDRESDWTAVWSLMVGAMGGWLIVYLMCVESEEADFSTDLYLYQSIRDDTSILSENPVLTDDESEVTAQPYVHE